MRRINTDFLPNGATYSEMESPVGQLIIITSYQGLHAILWENECKDDYFGQKIACLIKSDQEQNIKETKCQLNEYFQGQRKTFNLPLVINGTDFQVKAWNELLKIPYASTVSYAMQAKNVGNKNKARAVGMANRLNPVSIIIPCHRVIGSNGNLVGFAGGTDKKEYLLRLEKKNI